MYNFVGNIFKAGARMDLISEKGQICGSVFLGGRRSRRWRGGSRKKVRDEVSEVGSGVGRLLELNRGTDNETEPSVR